MAQTITLVLDEQQGTLSEFNALMDQFQQRVCNLENKSAAQDAKIADLENATSDARVAALEAAVSTLTVELAAIKANLLKAADALDD